MPSSIGAFGVARIIKRGSREKVPLWTPARPFLASIEVEVGLSQNGLIRASLEAPYAAGIALLEEPDLIVQSNILQVRLGYSASGNMTPWYAGLMTTAGAQISPNGVSISIEAHGGAALAMTRQTQASWTDTKAAIVKDIAQRFGWETSIDDESGLSGVVTVQGGGKSVWLLLEEILGESNYNFFMGVNAQGKATLFVLRGETWTATSAKRSFVMYGSVDLKKNQYPLLSFQADTQAVFLWSGSDGLQSITVDDDGNEVVTVADETTTATASLGAEANTSGKTDEQDPETGLVQDMVPDEQYGRPTISPASSDADTATRLQAEFDRRQMMSGFKIEAESIGVPLMQPGEVVGVYGTSKLYDGLYGVFKVTHRLGADGFTTSWEGRRNAFPSGKGAKVQVVAPENTQTEPENPNENGQA
jgi:hypothetical protein